MRIKFVRDYKVKAEGGEAYKAGDEIEVSENTARHFTSRGAAVAVKPEKPAKAEVAETKKAAAETKKPE